MSTKEMVCIVCPNGCHLTVTGAADALTVTGYRCPRGEAFARAELTCPMRSLTTTVRLCGGCLSVLPVRTDGELPKGSIRAAMAQLNGITVQAPVTCGQIILKDLAGSGVDAIATASMDRL